MAPIPSFSGIKQKEGVGAIFSPRSQRSLREIRILCALCVRLWNELEPRYV